MLTGFAEKVPLWSKHLELRRIENAHQPHLAAFGHNAAFPAGCGAGHPNRGRDGLGSGVGVTELIKVRHPGLVASMICGCAFPWITVVKLLLATSVLELKSAAGV